MTDPPEPCDWTQPSSPDPFLPTVDEIIAILVDINRATWQLLLHADDAEDSPTPEDFEQPLGSTHPASESLDMLSRFRFEPEDMLLRPPTDERQSRSGREQAPVDRLAWDFRQRMVREYLGDIITAISGEEGSADRWAEVRNLAKGRYALLDDPVDGTINLKCMRVGWSSNFVLVQSLGGGDFRPIAVVVTIATGETLVCDILKVRSRFISPTGVSRDIESGQQKVEQGTVALVASRGRSRKVASKLFDPDADWSLPPKAYGGGTDPSPALEIFTLGGAPAMAAWHKLQLAYLVVPSPQTVYDACALVSIMMSRGSTYFVAETGEAATLDEVINWMGTITGPDGATAKPVKAGLLVRDGALPTVTERVLDVVRGFSVTQDKRDEQGQANEQDKRTA